MSCSRVIWRLRIGGIDNKSMRSNSLIRNYEGYLSAASQDVCDGPFASKLAPTTLMSRDHSFMLQRSPQRISTAKLLLTDQLPVAQL